ncbi:MAG: hypothetical protein A07HB70_00791 [uncultured archaeon A07HB70]|nr:MAG: hypothetical protein A07HB70_00791 [uncultured archaeon A07HB70]
MPRLRSALPALALVALVLLSGCTGLLGGGSVSDDQLAEEPAGGEPYAWDANTTAHVAVTENARFRAVYEVNRSARDSVELFRRDGFGGRSPIPVTALRYRYPNGTEVNGTEFDERGGGVSRNRDRVNVTLPAQASGTGELAFSSSSTPKQFTLPVFVEGSYVVVLPENRRVGVPPFGSVSPGGSETVRDENDRTVVRWEEVTADSLAVRFYLERDLLAFGVIVGLGVVVGGGGLLYYRRKIQRLRRQREEMGLDVDVDDDDSRRPPPGMG